MYKWHLHNYVHRRPKCKPIRLLFQMDSKMPEICCHGYLKPKSSGSNDNFLIISNNEETKNSKISVGLQTESSELILNRPKSIVGLNNENNFFQRYRDSNYNRSYSTSREVTAKPLKSRYRSPSVKEIPIYRTGRMGACWRHMKRVTGPNGENIMFIDGTVKESDCHQYPPHGYPSIKLSPKPFLTHSDIQNYLRGSKSKLQHRINEIIRKGDQQEDERQLPNTPSTSRSSTCSRRYGHKEDKTQHLHIHLQLYPHELKELAEFQGEIGKNTPEKINDY